MAGFQVKVVLEGVQPPLWRRILLPDQLSFADLHVILQIVFGWQEEHLHDFSFQRSRVRISDTEYADADLDEKDVCADSYLKAGWIRYTYDFGDDWSHKIVLEKELEDYEKRYPTVVKHKRGNMAEDSGGAWYGEESSEIYDEERVNSLLKENCFCEVFAGEAGQDILVTEVLLDDFMKKMGLKQKIQRPKKKSALERKIEEIHNFYEEMDKLQKLSGSARQIKEGQQSNEGQFVFNFETGETDIEEELPDFYFCKCESNITQEELLAQGAEQLINDYAKYLMIPPGKSRSKKDTEQAILEVLQAHPEYYLIFMDEITVQNYLLSVEKNVGEFFPAISEKSLVVLCTWGLWDVKIYKKSGKNRMDISAAKGNEILLQFLKSNRLHQFYSTKKLITDGIFYLMQSYGFMESSALHEKYQKAFGPIAYEDLMRYVYLDGRLFGKYETGECLIDNRVTSFVSFGGLDANQVLEQMKAYGQGLEYADFKNKQLLKWKEGIAGFIPAWEDLGEILVNLEVLLPEALEEFLPELYQETVSGLELHELLYIIEEIMTDEPEDPVNMLQLTMIWMVMAKCWLDTPLACLKGCSRTSPARRTGKEPFTISVDEDSDITPDELDGDEQIYELPWSMQQEIYYLLNERESKKGRMKALEGVRGLAKSVGKEMVVFEVLERVLGLR